MKAKVWIARHGETDANRNKIFQGQLDTSLNQVGIDQAELLAGALKNVPFSYAFSSDLNRASTTAEYLLIDHPDVKLECSKLLRERFMGKLEGMTYKGDLAPELWDSAEPAAEFAHRSITFWKTKIVPLVTSHKGEQPLQILIVSHGGFIGTLVQQLLGSRKVTRGEGITLGHCVNTSVAVVEMEADGKGALTKYGDASHLEAGAVEDNVDEVTAP